MKKWYALVGILATVMCIALGMWSVNADKLGRLEDDLVKVGTELRITKTELSDTLSQLAYTEAQLSAARAKLAKLLAPQEVCPQCRI